jgi:hypothetical protein
MSKSSTEVKACFGKLEEDAYFSPSGIEKPKYRSQLEVELRFKDLGNYLQSMFCVYYKTKCAYV